MSLRRVELPTPQPAVRKSHTLRSPWPYVDFKRVSGKVRTVGTNSEINTNRGQDDKDEKNGLLNHAKISWLTFIVSFLKQYQTTCNRLFGDLYEIWNLANSRDFLSDEVIMSILQAMNPDNKELSPKLSPHNIDLFSKLSPYDKRVKFVTYLLTLHFPYGHSILDSKTHERTTNITNLYRTNNLDNEFKKMRSRIHGKIPHQMFDFHMCFCDQLSKTNDKLIETLIRMIRSYLIKKIVEHPDGSMSSVESPFSKQTMVNFVGDVGNVHDNSAVDVTKTGHSLIQIIDPLMSSEFAKKEKPCKTTSKSDTTIDDDSVRLHVETFEEWDTVFSYFIVQMNNMYDYGARLQTLFLTLNTNQSLPFDKTNIESALSVNNMWLTRLKHCTSELDRKVGFLRYQMREIINNLDCYKSEEKLDPQKHFPFEERNNNFENYTREEYVFIVQQFIQSTIPRYESKVYNYPFASKIIPVNIVYLESTPFLQEQIAMDVFRSFWTEKLNQYVKKTATLFEKMIGRLEYVQSNSCFEKNNLDRFFIYDLQSDGNQTRDPNATQLILNIHSLFNQNPDKEMIKSNGTYQLLENYVKFCKDVSQLNKHLIEKLLKDSTSYFQQDDATKNKANAAAISNSIQVDKKELTGLQLIEITKPSDLEDGAYANRYELTVNNLQEFHFLIKYCVTKFYDLLDRLHKFTTLQEEKFSVFEEQSKKPGLKNELLAETLPSKLLALSDLKWTIRLYKENLKALDQNMWIWYNFLSDISKNIDSWKSTESDTLHKSNPIDRVTEVIDAKVKVFRAQSLERYGTTRYHNDRDPSEQEGSIENIVYVGE